MKRAVMVGLLVLGLAGLVQAAVEVKGSGARVGKVETLNFSTGLTATKSGTDVTVSVSSAQSLGALTATSAEIDGILTTDGSIYTAKIVSDGAIYGGRATVDPCGTLGAGYIFFNNTTGAPCFCNNLGVDLSLYNGTSACF